MHPEYFLISEFFFIYKAAFALSLNPSISIRGQYYAVEIPVVYKYNLVFSRVTVLSFFFSKILLATAIYL